jgi:hypothetical protein
MKVKSIQPIRQIKSCLFVKMLHNVRFSVPRCVHRAYDYEINRSKLKKEVMSHH